MIALGSITTVAARTPDKFALVHDDGAVTWAQFETQVRATLAALVAAFSDRPPRRAAYIARNSHRLAAAMSAFSTLRTPFVGLDFTGALDLHEHCLRTVGAELLVVADEFAARAAALAELTGVRVVRLSELERSDAPAPTPEQLAHFAARPFEALGFTSGTSGFPKGVLRTTSFDARRFAYLAERYGFGADDVFLMAVPAHHASGAGWARMFLTYGATVVLTDETDPEALAAALRQANVTATLIVPPMLQRMLAPLERNARPSALRFIMTGGKFCPPDLKAALRELVGPVLHEYYGTTESGVNTLVGPDEMQAHPASAGSAMDGSTIAILDAALAPLPTGRSGRVAIASYQMMDGYLGGGEQFVELDGERYFLTPDVGHLDDAGRLHLSARSDLAADADLDAYAIETALRAVPGVRDAVVGSGEQGVTAYVAADAADVAAPAAAAIATLTALDVPVAIVSHIPYRLTGKVDFKALRAQAAPQTSLAP